MSTNDRPGFRFPAAQPYTSDDKDAFRLPMPLPQPFVHGSVLYRPPSGHPSSPPELRPAYGPWQNDSVGAENHNAWPGAHQQTQSHPPPYPGERSPFHSYTQPPSYPSAYHDTLPPREPERESPIWYGSTLPSSPASNHQAVDATRAPTGAVVRDLNAEDIKPDDINFTKLANAVRELGVCKTIFEQCDDKFVSEL